jgi:hypothetical protein
MKLLLLAAVTGVLLLVPRVAGADESQRELNNGYSLMHRLCEQEKQVDMILIVKTTPKAVADFAHEVSKTAGENLDSFDRMAAHDPAIRFDVPGLPPIETQTRKSIQDDKQHMLLFGTKDADFAKTLLVTQVEAGTYGMNMCKVLADDEPNGRRATELRRISSRWEKLRDKAYTLLYQM